MSSRRNPYAMSWNINPDTIFQDEQEFHGLPGDTVLIEEWHEVDETWILCDRELRLTLTREATKEET